jgi:hypothetical protein
LFDPRLPSEALKICGIYGTAEAVPFLRESFRTSATFGFCLLSNSESKTDLDPPINTPKTRQGEFF